MAERDGGPAFPVPLDDFRDHTTHPLPGMSLRDYFAGQALAGMYANPVLMQKAINDWCQNGGPRPTCVAEWFCGMAYEAADALLAARDAGEGRA